MIVYTAIYGGYDFLHWHPEIEGVEWRCYTDGEHIGDDAGWDIVTEPGRHAHPRTSAKWRKCHPPLDHDRSLWVDGCAVVRHEDFVRQVEGLLTEQTPLALWRHPDRSDIYAEAQVSARMRKYQGLDVVGQVRRYAERLDPLTLGLYASTVIGRLHTPEVLQMCAAWFAHCDLETYQDQLSLPVLLHDYGITPVSLPGSLTAAHGFAWLPLDHRSTA